MLDNVEFKTNLKIQSQGPHRFSVRNAYRQFAKSTCSDSEKKGDAGAYFFC